MTSTDPLVPWSEAKSFVANVWASCGEAGVYFSIALMWVLIVSKFHPVLPSFSHAAEYLK